MFTIDQINEAFQKVKSGADFPQFIQDLKKMGIRHYDTFVADGNTIFYGEDNFVLHGKPKYAVLEINNESSVEKLKHAIAIHQQGETDYPTFCIQASEAGVEKWTIHMLEMTVTYFDKFKNKLVVEQIPQPILP